jgi:hypothetical protein
MFRTVPKGVLVGLMASTLIIGVAGAAFAVSGGGYDPRQQDCSYTADAYQAAPSTEPGCHTIAVNVEDGSGQTRYAQVGLDQYPEGSKGTPTFGYSVGYPQQECAVVNPSGTGGGPGDSSDCGNGLGAIIHSNLQNPSASDPPSVEPQTTTPDPTGLQAFLTNGFSVYFGQDDNSDAGEHDGVNPTTEPNTLGSVNGPSDGGGTGVYVRPADAGNTPTASDPVPVAGAHLGFCADGLCLDTTTHQQTVYQGCSPDNGPAAGQQDVQCSSSSSQSRDVANYQGKHFDPQNCSSGDVTSATTNCPGGMDSYRQQEAHNVNAQPGVQVYEDPDPQGSPATPGYPIPGVYAGTCGVILGGGQTPDGKPTPTPPAPVPTNSAGQVVISPTNC